MRRKRNYAQSVEAAVRFSFPRFLWVHLVCRYTADDRTVRVIAELPVPQNITDLRAFIGLVNQLGSFLDETACAAHPLQDLLKPRNHCQWTPVHQQAFEAVKQALTQPLVLAYFNADHPTALHADATRLHGLGHCLLQHQQGQWRLFRCGSRFVTDVESRYAAIKLEMLVVIWAVRECRLFLAGLPSFDVVTNHRPLIPILNQKSLAEIENPRLLRLKEKLFLTASVPCGKRERHTPSLTLSQEHPSTIPRRLRRKRLNMRTSACYSIPSESASASFSLILQMPWLPTLLLIGYAQLLVLIQTT